MTTEEETTNITAPVAPLRVCCYGSSSSRTPERYIDAAYRLGRTLAIRGHTCVNGAGISGCMDAMNKGSDDAGGRIVGVIHEKFVKRGSDWFEGTSSVFRRDRGGGVVDEGGRVGGQTSGGGGTGGGGERNKNKHEHEIVIARGNDLQERKRLLVEGADALVVLPGGPGTWDELWEMACARHIGFHSIPIVCINVDGYYDPFRAMLTRAHDDMLLYKHPNDILHFEETPEAAVEWIESYLADPKNKPAAEERQELSNRDKLKRMQSNLSGSTLTIWRRMGSFFGDDDDAEDDPRLGAADYGGGGGCVPWRYLTVFTAGLSMGVIVASRMSSSASRI